MSNVSKGHGFEREVKKLFVDAGWFCTRAAASQSPMDLIAYKKLEMFDRSVPALFEVKGYTIKLNCSTKIPLAALASKRDGINLKHVYYEVVSNGDWCIVLMQCKINRRRLKK